MYTHTRTLGGRLEMEAEQQCHEDGGDDDDVDDATSVSHVGAFTKCVNQRRLRAAVAGLLEKAKSQSVGTAHTTHAVSERNPPPPLEAFAFLFVV